VTSAGETESERRTGKSATAFRTTGEAAEELDLPAHVLRFWESKFPQLRPVKRGGGRRYYRPEDIDLLRRIRQCLRQEGYTIRGVQRLLREGEMRRGGPGSVPAKNAVPPGLFALPPASGSAGAADAKPSPEALRAALDDVRRELSAIRALLEELIGDAHNG
jgi:DNA-binding transcriptional MerR regulator